MARLQGTHGRAGRGLKRIRRVTFQALQGLGTGDVDLASCARIVRAWESIVGENMSRQLWPVLLADGVLTLGATSGAWMQEARFMETAILQNLRKQVPGVKIRELKLVTSRKPPPGIEKPRSMPPVEETLSRPLPEEVERQIEETLASLEDRTLAEGLKRLFRLSKLSESERGPSEAPDRESDRGLEDHEI